MSSYFKLALSKVGETKAALVNFKCTRTQAKTSCAANQMLTTDELFVPTCSCIFLILHLRIA